jgi:thiosulfate dehydrogenase (quinone) large subunit
MQDQRLQTAFLRVGLGVGFLSAVADRLGLWGSYGRPNVAWGDMQHFLPYVGKLNPWFPTAIIPTVGWAVTIGETALGILLLIGFQTRWAALLSGCLLLAFALGMTIGAGVKTAFDASVFAASGGAFMLATARKYPWSVDELMSSASQKHPAAIRQ